MSGIFGTLSWTEKKKDDPFKADGRDILPALRKWRGEVRAVDLTIWGMVWRLAMLIALVVSSCFFIYMGLALAHGLNL